MDKLIYSIDTTNALVSCPNLYSQDGKGDKAIAFVKFFIPGSNFEWYITEYNHNEKLAFGFINLNDPEMAELGYISIDELASMSHMIYRDIDFIPKTLKEIKKDIGI